MAELQTYSIPACLDFDVEAITNGSSKQIAGPCELAYLKLSGGGPGNVTIHDVTTASNAGYNNQKFTLDCSSTSNDTLVFPNPAAFKKGVAVVLRQGSGLTVTLCYGTVLP